MFSASLRGQFQMLFLASRFLKKESSDDTIARSEILGKANTKKVRIKKLLLINTSIKKIIMTFTVKMTQEYRLELFVDSFYFN